MPDLIAASTWVVLTCVVLSFSMFSPLPFASKRLLWLVCSILQYVALQDGPYHAILSTTSSMALRAQVLNGFGSMYLVRGNQSPNPPWDRPDDTTTYREWRKFYHFDVYWPSDSTGGTTMGSVSQPVSYASFYTWQYRDWVTRGYQRLGHPRPNIARPVFASGSPDLMYAGLSSSSTSSNSDGG